MTETCDKVTAGIKCGAPATVVLDPPNLPGITRNLCAEHAEPFSASMLKAIEGVR